MILGMHYTKCFDLIPQGLSHPLRDAQGMEKKLLNDFEGMYP